MHHRTDPLRAETVPTITATGHPQNPAVAAARTGTRTGGRRLKPRGFGPIGIALGLLVAGGGIAWAVSVARHVRRYSTALLKLGPPPGR